MKINSTVNYIYLICLSFILAGCSLCNPQKQFAQRVLDQLTQAKSLVPLSFVASQEIYEDEIDAYNAKGAETEDYCSFSRYEYKRALDRHFRFFDVTLKDCFKILEMVGKDLRVKYVETCESLEGLSQLDEFGFIHDGNLYRIQMGYLLARGDPVLDYIFWEDFTWQHLVLPVVKPVMIQWQKNGRPPEYAR